MSINWYCSLPCDRQEERDALQLPSCTCPQTPAQPSIRFISQARPLHCAWVSLPYVTVWEVDQSRKLTFCACFLSRTTPWTSVVKFLKTVAWRILCSVIVVYGSRVNLTFITTSWSELDIYSLSFISVYFLFPFFVISSHTRAWANWGLGLYICLWDRPTAQGNVYWMKLKGTKIWILLMNKGFPNPIFLLFLLNKDDSLLGLSSE